MRLDSLLSLLAGFHFIYSGFAPCVGSAASSLGLKILSSLQLQASIWIQILAYKAQEEKRVHSVTTCFLNASVHSFLFIWIRKLSFSSTTPSELSDFFPQLRLNIRGLLGAGVSFFIGSYGHYYLEEKTKTKRNCDWWAKKAPLFHLNDSSRGHAFFTGLTYSQATPPSLV